MREGAQRYVRDVVVVWKGQGRGLCSGGLDVESTDCLFWRPWLQPSLSPSLPPNSGPWLPEFFSFDMTEKGGWSGGGGRRRRRGGRFDITAVLQWQVVGCCGGGSWILLHCLLRSHILS